MRLTPAAAVLGMFFFLALGALLRRDLALHAWLQGRSELQRGEYRAALASLEKGGEGAADPGAVAFDAGVALYRLGSYREARERFAFAAQKADADARSAALFNRGNCAYRLAERAAAKNDPAAPGLLREAAASYGEALALAPALQDASHNLEIVRRRMAALPAGGEGGGDARSGSADAGLSANAGRDGDSRSRESLPGAEAQPRHAERRAAWGTGDEARRSGSGGGSKAPAVTQEEAERLLSEARSREGTPILVGQGGGGDSAPPLKDW